MSYYKGSLKHYYGQTVSVEQLHMKWLLGEPCTQCEQGGSRCRSVGVSTLNNRKVLPFHVIVAPGPAVSDVGPIAALLLKDHSDCHQGCENSTGVRDGTR